MTLDRLTTTQLELLRMRTQQREDAAHSAIDCTPHLCKDFAAVHRYWLRGDVADRVRDVYRQRLIDDLS